MSGVNKEKDKDNNCQMTSSRLQSLWLVLKSQPLIEIQIKFQLFCAHVHLPFTRYYDHLYGQLANTSPEVTQRSHRFGDHRMSFANFNEWDWRGLPDEWPLARLWSLCSTAWMCVVIMKTLFSEQLFALAHLLTGWPGHCVIMGRFVIHPSIAALLAFLFASFHLSWRCTQQLKTRAYMLGIFSFLLQTERDLKHFYTLIRVNAGAIYLSGCDKVEVPDDRKLGNGAASIHEHFFRHIMCYEVHLDSGRVVYKLRPNRTWQSRATLVDSFVHTSFVATCAFSTLAVPIFITILLLCLSDIRFVQTYPGCQPDLDYLYTSGQLKSFWSFTVTGYRVVSALFEIPENVLVWVDSGLALTFVMSSCYIMNSDILLYWRHLHARIELDLGRVRELERRQREVQYDSRGKDYLSEVDRLPGRSSWRNAWVELEHDEQQLAVELNELQCEMLDFFQQVERTDRLVSDILTMAILIWLLAWAGLNLHNLAQRGDSEFPVVVRFLELFGLTQITLTTHYMLKLHKSCMRSYNSINSLMAEDQLFSSSNRKYGFLKLMEFFTKRQATTYTLFQRIPYLATTYITIIGWSFSSLVVCYGLFGRQRHQLSTGSLDVIANNATTTTTTTRFSDVPILGGPKYSLFSTSL